MEELSTRLFVCYALPLLELDHSSVKVLVKLAECKSRKIRGKVLRVAAFTTIQHRISSPQTCGTGHAVQRSAPGTSGRRTSWVVSP